MSRPAKILAWLLAAFVAVFALAAIVFFLFFDPNDFRESISAKVKESTGRELAIEGDISLSFFPWLAVEVGRSSMGNAPGFGDEPFAAFERAKLSVRLLPLIFGQGVVIGSAEVDGLVLNLAANRQGVSNWGDLASGGKAGKGDAAPTGDADVDIVGVSFSNATVSYRDARSGSRYSLSDADLRVGPVSGNRQSLVVDGLRLDGTLEGVGTMPSEFEFGTDSIGVDTVEKVITLAPLSLSALGLEVAAVVEPISYAGDVQPVATIEVGAFSPRSLMTLFGAKQPQTADPTALSRVIIDGKAALTSSALALSNLELKLDDTTLRGKLSIPRGDKGRYDFDLDADRIELGRYMAPAAAAKGEAGDTMPVKIPSDLIRPLNARGNLRVATASLGKIVFDNVVLGLNAGGGRLRLHPVSSSLFGGTYEGDVRIDVSGKTPVLSVDERIENVNLGNLVKAMFDKNNVTGGITGAFTLSGRGNDMDAIQQSLSGNMSFQLDEGSYEGTDIWYELRRARALVKGEAAPTPKLPPRTRFSSVTATGVVQNGVMRNDDLYAELPYLQLRGRGTVNLVAATLDYGLEARVLEKPESLAGITAAELEDFSRAVIPLKITGPLASPSVKPDVERLVKKRVEDEIKKKLFDKLGVGEKKPAPAEGEAAAPADAAPVEGEPGEQPPAEEEPKDIEDELKDEVKNKLKDLFNK